MEVPYINWMQKINVYETASKIYLVGADVREENFQILKIDRSPVPLLDDSSFVTEHEIDSIDATIEAETLADRMWRLNIVSDSHIYNRNELARLLHTIQATNRYAAQSLKENKPSTSGNKWSFRVGDLFSKSRSSMQKHGSHFDENLSATTSETESNILNTPRDLQQAAASALFSGTAERSLVLSMKCHGIVGVVRFLRGYYLILITKCKVIAQLGEHQIYKVEDTALLYIPGNQSKDEGYSTSLNSKSQKLLNHDETDSHSESSSNQNVFQFLKSTVGRNKILTDEMRYVKLFGSVDLASNFYFSYTYDLSHSMQYNMEPVFGSTRPSKGHVWAIRSVLNDRFVWNWRLIPLRFRNLFDSNHYECAKDLDGQPSWFIPIYHGYVGQSALSACGMPLMITLIARRSRHFAGRRFLKRGSNLLGDVANEVETEQIVHDSSYRFLSQGRISSYVQLRGSVPLFWSQEPSKVVVGRPPIEIQREDPYFETMGFHFANLLQRYGSPLIILNLMKRREKRQFEICLSNGFERGITYLNQFLPSKIPRPIVLKEPLMDRFETNPPIIYIGFDIARVQKLKNVVVLDQLKPILNNCIRRTGIFFSAPFSSDDADQIRSFGFNSQQCGVIRVNCVDCLDRTNTTQFVIGRVVLAYQLHYLGFLAEPNFSSESRIDRLLQELYDEHGDTLALQYGGSQLVHNIDTYRKISKLSSQSRDFVQTLSRYYSNKFSDWEKQCAINLFLRIYRPNLWSGTLSEFVLDHFLLSQSDPEDNGKSNETHPDSISSSTLTAIAISSSNGSLWDLGSDNHLHWIESWGHLSVFRVPLTNWCSKSLLDSLPRGLDIMLKSQLYCSRSLQLFRDDIRVDWFTELNQPHLYESLNKSPMAHLRWVEISAHCLSPDNLAHRLSSGRLTMIRNSLSDDLSFLGQFNHSPHLFNPKLAQSSHRDSNTIRHLSCAPLNPIPIDLGSAISASYSFPNLIGVSSFETGSTPNSTYRLTSPPADSNPAPGNKYKIKSDHHHRNHKSKFKIRKEPHSSSSNQNLKEIEDESSSESDFDDLDDTVLAVYPPALESLFNPSDVYYEPTPTKSYRRCLDNADIKESPLSEKHISNSLKKCRRQYSQLRLRDLITDICAPNMPVTTTNVFIVSDAQKSVYERYLKPDHQFSSLSWTSNPELQMNYPKPVDQESLEIYKNYVRLAVTGPSTISVQSMQAYMATAEISCQLRC